jgi:hypothetical protein
MGFWDLLNWWNLVFALPFVGALFYLLLMAMGVVVDHGVDLHMEHDIGIGHDMGVEHNAELGHDAGHDGGHDAGHDHSPSLLNRFLSFFGVGKVPISVIIMSFCFLWGFIGIVANLFYGTLMPPGVFFWASFFTALVLSVFLTRYLALLMGKIMPTTETYGITVADLTGFTATTTTNIDNTFGQAQVYDKSGNLQTVPCRVKKGEKPVTRGTQVVLMFYDRIEKVFYINTDMPASNLGQ